MNMRIFSAIFCILLMLCACQNPSTQAPVSKDRLFAWCIVPFDSLERSPKERINMLQSLGITSYAYDWREKHLDEMAEEMQLADQAGIEVKAIWMWLDARSDSVGKLSTLNERLLSIMEETDIRTQLWVSFNSNFFENQDDQAALEAATAMIDYVAGRASDIECKIGLYNHGNWFGEPSNQIQIIHALPSRNLGLIYNFHHAHEQLERYGDIVAEMLPYLWAVNLNGMRKEGPKILSIGKGDLEKDMIQLLLDKGYEGDFGILGHIETEDVEQVLTGNLKGLQTLGFVSE